MLKKLSAILCLVSLTVSCGGGGDADNSGSEPVRGVTDTEIIIGSHGDLSGPVALLGTELVYGARLRFEQANAVGGVHGRQINFIVEDAQYQVPRAIQATNKLVNRDNIFAMILGMGTPMNNAVMQTLFDAGVPNIFPISGARQMVEPIRPMMFTARGLYYDETRAGVRYFVEERGAQNVCVMYQDSDYGQEIFEATGDQLAAMSMEVTASTSHRPTDTEFTAPVLRLRNAGCDTIMMGTINRDTILIFEAARKMGWTDVAFVGQNAAYNKSIAAVESGASEGYYAFVHIAAIYGDDQMTPEVAEFYSSYAERFGAEPGYPAIEGYRNAGVIVDALERAGENLTVASFLTALESMTEYEDIFGYRLTFGPDDHKGVDESVLVTVRDGRWVTLEESVTY
jgi:branched-chain amino acid transport system substrate-binding protein